MKKTIHKTIRTSAVALLFLSTAILHSCTKADEPKGNIPADGVMRFEALAQEPQTRAGYDDDNITGTVFSFWAATQGETAGSNYIYNSYLLHYENSEWKTANAWDSRNNSFTDCTLLWKNSKTKVDVTAANFGISSVGNELSPNYSLFVSGAQTYDDAVKQSDFIFFHGTVNPELTTDKISGGVITEYALVDGKIRLPMRHICSKLILTVTLGTEFSVDEGLGRNTTTPFARMNVGGTYRYDHFDMCTGTFLGDFKNSLNKATQPDKIELGSFTYTPASSASDRATAVYEAILIPQQVPVGTFRVGFTLGGNYYEWTAPSAITLASGKQYTLALSVGKDVETVGSFTLAEWGTSNNGENIITD